MLTWLRRRLGESGELSELRSALAARDARVAGLGRELAAAYEDLIAVRELREAAESAAADRLRVVDRLLEPIALGRECAKVRLYNRADAVAFARLVERATRAGELEPYRCLACPRYPLTLARYWHVRHVDPELRGERGRRERDRRPGDAWEAYLLIRDRVAPATRERLEKLCKES
jgi:hypothetical protein